MYLGTLFDFSVERFPDRIALVQGKQRYTYQQLSNEVTRVASSLQKHGVGKQDRVMIILKNRLETVILYWAVQKLGAVFTPINFRLSGEEVEYCVNDAGAKVVVYEGASKDAVKMARFQNSPLLVGLEDDCEAEVTYKELVDKGADGYERPDVKETDVALMLYTSGTTGRPKGVPRTHMNEYSAALAHTIQNQYADGESTLGVMPLYHTMGMRSLLSMLVLNGKFAILPDFDSEDALKVLSEEKISCVYLVPTLYHDILHHPRFGEYNLSHLKKIGYAGAAMTTALAEKCKAMLQPNIFVNHYGSTEVYTFTICPDVAAKPGSAGKPGIHQNIRLVVADPDGKSTANDVVGIGEVGEIIANTESGEAFKGYWNRPDATAKAIREGWYFTGDLGVLDQDGDLFVVGRVDDMIISGGENIHPLEVEDLLAKHPKVSEVAIVGEPDERWGQIVTAYVVPKDSLLTMQELDQYCKASAELSNFKRPRKYVFVTEIPKSPVGKILRRKLREGDYSEYEARNNAVS
ncbi:class I adenylate-forming enzyme family protein [Ammoniphilus sp. CFH 90114]|uniref:class I adenylate-forming enzyme family protein n=1 Tax=Ammoniphilus sp. CFH 90114 TaxID=2493665 RepID=UPI00100E6648|nr:AMP-binding protein [Ammoniphilus sp. CFH 90114]RXT13699.1 long-chain fatty acid--CoA ligase [Ammoniphilus sp. CFH 90114]